MTAADVREYVAFAAKAVVADAVVSNRTPRPWMCFMGSRAHPLCMVTGPAAVGRGRPDLEEALQVLRGTATDDGHLARQTSAAAMVAADDDATQRQAATVPEPVPWRTWKAAAVASAAPPSTASMRPPPASGVPHPSATYTHYSYNSWFASDRPIAQRSPAGLGEAIFPTPLARPEPVAPTSEVHAAYAELLAVAAWRAGVAPEALHRVVHGHEMRLIRLARRYK